MKYIGEQTIREMLQMKTLGKSAGWFTSGDPDRTHHYFNDVRLTHPSGTLWCYDSPGSQVLCALVEKLSGKKLLEYMKEKLFNEMGYFQGATVFTPSHISLFKKSRYTCRRNGKPSTRRCEEAPTTYA